MKSQLNYRHSVIAMCNKELVSGQEYNITDRHLTASSVWPHSLSHGPQRGRLHLAKNSAGT